MLQLQRETTCMKIWLLLIDCIIEFHFKECARTWKKAICMYMERELDDDATNKYSYKQYYILCCSQQCTWSRVERRVVNNKNNSGLLPTRLWHKLKAYIKETYHEKHWDLITKKFRCYLSQMESIMHIVRVIQG